MKFKNLFFILLLELLTQCNPSTTDQPVVKKNDSTQQQSAISFKENQKKYFDSIDFFKDCDKLIEFSSFQGLQGTDKSRDLTGYLCIADCYDCKETYELIFKYKAGLEKIKSIEIEEDVIFNIFKSGCSNQFSDFDCYAFVYPMRQPEPGECADKNGKPINCDSGVDYPVKVKAYYREAGNHWIFLEEKKIKDFEALSLFFYHATYSKLN